MFIDAKKKNIPAILFSILLSSSCIGADNFTPDKIRSDIKRIGAKATVDKIDMDKVCEKIDTGNSDWIKLGGELAYGTDAGTAFGLQLSLADALPLNPGAVLRVIDETELFPTIQDVCGFPFVIETEEVAAEYKDYVPKTIRALKELKDPVVEKQRVKCLMELEAVAKRDKKKWMK